jgi:hypothetical protein
MFPLSAFARVALLLSSCSQICFITTFSRFASVVWYLFIYLCFILLFLWARGGAVG